MSTLAIGTHVPLTNTEDPPNCLTAWTDRDDGQQVDQSIQFHCQEQIYDI